MMKLILNSNIIDDQNIQREIENDEKNNENAEKYDESIDLKRKLNI